VELKLASYARSVSAVDLLNIIFIALISIISIIYVPGAALWHVIAPINLGLCLAILFLGVASTQPRLRILRFLHDWYPVALIFLLFKEVYLIMQSGRGDIDQSLIAIDHWLFGVNPTVWLTRFSAPVLTEILQLAYVSYYLLMITLAVELHLRGDLERFSFVMFTVTYGFFLSYFGYMLFPAVGPRLTLHTFGSINKELPGLYFTDALRSFLNSGESIPNDVPNPIAVAQRDAFPSGHTQMTLIILYFAHLYRVKSRYVLYVVGTLLIISTVYLRYHYVVDLIGGVLFMAFTVWTAPKLFAWLKSWSVGTERVNLHLEESAPASPE
jgi:membrane-associated phospholipid phosphatase